MAVCIAMIIDRHYASRPQAPYQTYYSCGYNLMQRNYRFLRLQKKNGLAGFMKVTEMKSRELGVAIARVRQALSSPLNVIEDSDLEGGRLNPLPRSLRGPAQSFRAPFACSESCSDCASRSAIQSVLRSLAARPDGRPPPQIRYRQRVRSGPAFRKGLVRAAQAPSVSTYTMIRATPSTTFWA